MFFDELVNNVPNENKAYLYRLGQSGFILRTHNKIVCMDLYLSDNPMKVYKSIINPEEIVRADVVFGSHDHPDHIDRAALKVLFENNSEAVLVVPDCIKETIEGIEQSRIIGIDDGKTLDISGIKITGIASAHEFLDRKEDGRYPYVGCIVDVDGFRIYQAGDTCLYPGLLEKLTNALPIDAMILPINGRDGNRLANGIFGNMTYQEAVDLSGIVKPVYAIPSHYDMFQGNLEDPQKFVDYIKVKYPEQKYWVGEIGEYLELIKRS